jgi:ribosomal protection tetracycline resistance protein
MYAGAVRTRDRLRFGDDRDAKVTAIHVFEHGASVQRSCVVAGQIGKLWGLADVRIGDAIGEAGASRSGHHFSPPTLETVIFPSRPSDRGSLRVALDQLAEQDPLINLRQDDVRQELYVSLYGEVQKEVIHDTLAHDYGIDVEFRETTTICIERPLGTGEAAEFIKANPFLATVGLRVEPGPIDSGVTFGLADDIFGTMPLAFFKAVEDSVYQTLQQGICGWSVTDCAVTMTHSGYYPRQSHAHQGFSKSMSSTGADFRGLTPLVLMDALKRAGTVVYEPMQSFRLEIPADAFGAVMPVLTRLRASPRTQELRPQAAGAAYVIEGDIPAAHVHELQQSLPALGRGEAMLEAVFDRYEPVAGAPPMRPRTDHNPLNRKEYLLHVLRRV